MRTLEDPELLAWISQLCPQHQIKRLVACRGMNRYIGPGERLDKGTAPLRRMIRIRRIHEDIDVDPKWEPWERLSLKGLRRQCTPTRVGLTVFASCRTSSEDTSRSIVAPTADAPIPADFRISERDHPTSDEHPSKRARIGEKIHKHSF